MQRGSNYGNYKRKQRVTLGAILEQTTNSSIFKLICALEWTWNVEVERRVVAKKPRVSLHHTITVAYSKAAIVRPLFFV